MNGLRLWHKYNHADWHGKEGWLPGILKAVDKKGVAFKSPPRGPITLAHLGALQACLDLTRPRDAAIWAAALAAFWGCRRLGELLIKSKSKFNRDHDVTRSTRVSRTTGKLAIEWSYCSSFSCISSSLSQSSCSTITYWDSGYFKKNIEYCLVQTFWDRSKYATKSKSIPS